MNTLTTNGVDDTVECPLCMEPLDVDDLNFFPCTCRYQICRFCWHRIRTDENELCPACRKEYPENPADFKPLTQEEMIAFKSRKRQRDQQRKQKITENRKHLANVRVVQKNLVFVVGLPPRLADADILKKHEYFGKYGKIHKVVINPSTTYAGIQGPSASAYVTYLHNTDALRAIQSVNNITIDGRLIKTSLGTTKYCSHFMKNQQCPKSDCMYLHELGDPEASFTKEEMHQGKHQEYEKRLHDVLIATAGTNINNASGLNSSTTNGHSNGGNSINPSGICTTENGSSGNRSNGTINILSLSSLCGTSNSPPHVVTAAFTNSNSITVNASNTINGNIIMPQKEAWPSLSVSPTTTTTVRYSNNTTSGNVNGNVNNNVNGSKNSSKKERCVKNEKTNRNDRTNGKVKNKTNNNSKDLDNSPSSLSTSSSSSYNNTGESQSLNDATVGGQKNKTDKNCNKKGDTVQQQQQSQNGTTTNRHHTTARKGEIKTTAAEEGEEESTSHFSNGRKHSNKDKVDNVNVAHAHTDKGDDQHSLSSNSSASNSNDISISMDDTNSGKSTPGTDYNEKSNGIQNISTATTKNATTTNILQKHDKNLLNTSILMNRRSDNNDDDGNILSIFSSSSSDNILDGDSLSETITIAKTNTENKSLDSYAVGSGQPKNTNQSNNNNNSNRVDISSKSDFALDLGKLGLFDGNSFFTSVGALQDSLLLKNKLSDATEISFSQTANQTNSITNPHLPDLINGIDGYQNNISNINDWEDAFKNVLSKSSSKHQLQLQQTHAQHIPHGKDIERLQELQKCNGLLNSLNMAQFNKNPLDLQAALSVGSEFTRLGNTTNIQQQQQYIQNQLMQQQNSNENCLQNTLFGTNMSKFFDFHKNQQQQKIQNCFNSTATNGMSESTLQLCDNLHVLSLLENNRMMNSQLFDCNYSPSTNQQQQQLQKQRYYGKIDQMLCQQQQQTQQQQSQQQLHASLHTNTTQTVGNPLQKHFLPNTSSDDDLGFDPFVETQKALAELMENEVEQQNAAVTSSSAKSPKVLQHNHHQPQQQQHQQVKQPLINNPLQTVDYVQRARMPPPGFNHMNNFGFGMARVQNNSGGNSSSSKIMPFMNLNGNSPGNANSIQQQQPQLVSNNSWGTTLNSNGGNCSQQQQHLTETHFRAMSTNPIQNNGTQKNFTGNDWTAMDPAILSFRQFSTYPHHNNTMATQMQQQRQQQQDLFMQHMAQQQNSGFTGFNGQTQMLGGNSLSNSVISPPQALQSHVNANVQGMLEYLKNRQFV